MGFLIGMAMIATGIFLAGAMVGRLTAPNRGPRASELKRARQALAELDEIVASGSLELSMLGSNVAEKAMDVLRKYWRGDHK
jgi:hypothetical protein